MSYAAKTLTVYDPEFFRISALAYNQNPTDRKKWLQGQLINLQASIYQYQIAIQDLMNEGAQLDGKSTAANWMQGIGAVAIVIPNIWTKAAGAIISLAGSIVGAAEKKKDSKALNLLAQRASIIQIEGTQIQNYYNSYESELTRLTYLPLALYAAAALILYKK